MVAASPPPSQPGFVQIEDWTDDVIPKALIHLILQYLPTSTLFQMPQRNVVNWSESAKLILADNDSRLEQLIKSTFQEVLLPILPIGKNRAPEIKLLPCAVISATFPNRETKLSTNARPSTWVTIQEAIFKTNQQGIFILGEKRHMQSVILYNAVEGKEIGSFDVVAKMREVCDLQEQNKKMFAYLFQAYVISSTEFITDIHIQDVCQRMIAIWQITERGLILIQQFITKTQRNPKIACKSNDWIFLDGEQKVDIDQEYIRQERPRAALQKVIAYNCTTQKEFCLGSSIESLYVNSTHCFVVVCVAERILKAYSTETQDVLNEKSLWECKLKENEHVEHVNDGWLLLHQSIPTEDNPWNCRFKILHAATGGEVFCVTPLNARPVNLFQSQMKTWLFDHLLIFSDFDDKSHPHLTVISFLTRKIFKEISWGDRTLMDVSLHKTDTLQLLCLESPEEKMKDPQPSLQLRYCVLEKKLETIPQ